MNGCYIVCNKRKSDGKLFFGEKVVVYVNQASAVEEAERRARHCSEGYEYAVVNLVVLSLSEKADIPVVTRYVLN